jgi:two-component system chemotaxis response regulator CheY
MRLFLCDDNPEYRMLARLVLEEAAHEIVGEAGDGVEAEEQAPALTPDVVLLDLNMPRRNGYEALPRLRELLPDSKIVVLTTGRAQEERERALTAGADGFIVKPDSVFDLAGELRRAVDTPPQRGG